MKRCVLMRLTLGVFTCGLFLFGVGTDAQQVNPAPRLLFAADEQPIEATPDLLGKLSTAFEVLAEKSKHRAELHKAAQLLEGTNQNTRWTDYKKAILIFRQTRSKAGVPLMMKYMIKHAAFGSPNTDEYLEAIALITGYDLGEIEDSGPDRVAKVQKRVDELYQQWWLPNKDKLVTSLQDMEDKQLEVVCNAVLKKVDWDQGYSRDFGGDMTAYRLYHLLYYKALKRSTSSSDRRPWVDGELDEAMVPLLLVKADYRPDGIPEGKKPTVHRVPYAVVDMLAALRKDNLAPQLDNIAEDPKQNSVTRLTCVFAMYAAGEKMDTLALMSILKNENRLEPRLNTIIALQHSGETKTVTPALLKLLDDRNVEIRTAAVYALRGAKPPEAVEKLVLMLGQPESASAASTILDLLGEIGTDEAKRALAELLAAALKDNDDKLIHSALRSFETATGERWAGAGANKKDYYREKAQEALAWWKKNRGR